MVDDEPDVELLFRQQFRHNLRAGRLTMEFAQSGYSALQAIVDLSTASLNAPPDHDVPGTLTLLGIPLLVFQKDGMHSPSHTYGKSPGASPRRDRGERDYFI